MNNTIKCIIVDDEPVARGVLENYIERLENLDLIASCKNAIDAFRIMNSQAIDLVFLDINMPEISGLTFAKSMSKDTRVIFTTAYREYAVDGFDLKAVDYLLKPISFERFLQGVNKYFEETSIRAPVSADEYKSGNEESIFVRSERKMVKVDFDSIICIESLGDYLKIHLENGKVQVTRDTLSNIEARLPVKEFLRIHRSFIVSIGKIESYTNDTIGIGKHEFPISRSYHDSVLKRLGQDSGQG